MIHKWYCDKELMFAGHTTHVVFCPAGSRKSYAFFTVGWSRSNVEECGNLLLYKDRIFLGDNYG